MRCSGSRVRRAPTRRPAPTTSIPISALDSLISLGSAAPARTVGIGFCAGDEYYDQPYFYVSRYPAPDVAALPALPPVGHWHTHHFTAAVAVADRIVAASDQRAGIETFLRAATDVLIPLP